MLIIEILPHIRIVVIYWLIDEGRATETITSKIAERVCCNEASIMVFEGTFTRGFQINDRKQQRKLSF